ncbi:MAG: CocE/NonD family hydrolase [Acidimicrobiaceae bacterium]|nr:CocE/NonD family hydrolase [Acidimicrobiaceae bacterium]
MSDGELAFRQGIDPATAGHPRVEPRTDHVDGMLVERDAAVAMRDGVRIWVDVYRPEDAEPVPTLVAWSPYGKHAPVSYDIFPNSGVRPEWISRHAGFEAPDPGYWVPRGYAVVNVDPRGLWYSEGEATFLTNQEAEDVYDLVEWAAAQEWSNGRVGMTGVSYLAMIQWRAAALRPPHLAAINPWEGVSDAYREFAGHGGMLERRFVSMWQARRVAYSTSRVEDLVENGRRHPLLDGYWLGKNPDLAAIGVPAFVVASWSDQGLHTRGTLRAFAEIGSDKKWLWIHGRKKWEHYYRPENVERLRQFFDRFLKGVESGVEGWPRVWMEVRDRFYEGELRSEADWPLARTRYEPLYLNATDRSLARAPVEPESEVTYNSEVEDDRIQFDHRFEVDTELIGPMKLKLWVEALEADDMDLFVAVQKLDVAGDVVPFSFLNSLEDGPVALGWLRVSHRELDLDRSTPERPWHTHRREERLQPGEVVPVEVEVWPSGTRFRAAETLRLIVQGSDIYRYDEHVVWMEHATRNRGRHVIHCGGRYDSHLLVPVTTPA